MTTSNAFKQTGNIVVGWRFVVDELTPNSRLLSDAYESALGRTSFSAPKPGRSATASDGDYWLLRENAADRFGSTALSNDCSQRRRHTAALGP
jgi:hypothetical protein